MKTLDRIELATGPEAILSQTSGADSHPDLLDGATDARSDLGSDACSDTQSPRQVEGQVEDQVEDPHTDRSQQAALIARAQAGDRAALNRLLADARPRLLAVALRVVRDRDEAEDVVQE